MRRFGELTLGSRARLRYLPRQFDEENLVKLPKFIFHLRIAGYVIFVKCFDQTTLVVVINLLQEKNIKHF